MAIPNDPDSATPIDVVSGPEADAGILTGLSDWIPGWAALQDQPWLLAAILLLVGLLAARLTQFIFSKILLRLTRKTDTDLDDRLIKLLSKPVFSTVFLATFIYVVLALKLSGTVTLFTVRILQTLILLSWTIAGVRTVRLTLEALGHIRKHFEIIQERTIPLFDMTLKVVLVGSSAYIFFLIWGIDPTAWLASAGIIGIAVGFAAKDTLANLFSGIFIVADSPYKLGDYIILDSGERGMVTQVGMRSTRLLTRDDIEITVPNAVIGNAKIINESGGPWEKERIRIKVSVAYGSDVDQVEEELLRVAQNHKHIVQLPEPRVRMRGFGQHGLNFELLCWIDLPELRGRLSHALYMEIYKRFAELAIEIPYSKHDVYIREMPAQQGLGD